MRKLAAIVGNFMIMVCPFKIVVLDDLVLLVGNLDTTIDKFMMMVCKITMMVLATRYYWYRTYV
jgi:hypothetical protein